MEGKIQKANLKNEIRQQRDFFRLVIAICACLQRRAHRRSAWKQKLCERLCPGESDPIRSRASENCNNLKKSAALLPFFELISNSSGTLHECAEIRRFQQLLEMRHKLISNSAVNNAMIE